MSFLSGILTFGRSAAGFLSGSSIASTLVKTAVLGYAMNRLSQSAIKGNDTGGGGSNAPNIDQGVRLQIPPAADNKIPVSYGAAYYGAVITDAEMSNNNKRMTYCLTLSEKTGSRYSSNSATTYVFKDVYWNNQRMVFRADGITVDYVVDKAGNVDRSLSGQVKVYCYAGSSTAGQVPENYTGTVPAAYTVMPGWAIGTHLMTDLIFAIVEVNYNREQNVTGIADMLFHVDSSMKQPGDVLYDYLTNSRYGAGIPTDEINTTSIAALNTYSLESVTYTDETLGAGQTLPDRYQINGVIDTDKPVLENIEAICSAAGSWLSYDIQQGLWGVSINRAGTAVANFNDSNILGSISISGSGITDLYNSVNVEFPSRELKDSADFVRIGIPSNLRNSNEPDNVYNLTYDIINEPIQAELLGFIELKQSRVDLVVRFSTDWNKINLKAGEIISVTQSRYSWNQKLFRIITVTEVQDDDGALMVDIVALEYDSSVYSTSDLFRYTRVDQDGIVGIGVIGKPGTPQVTKFEQASRPHVLIETTAPTGVVDGMEFWISTDVSLSESSRTYTILATVKPQDGGVFASGEEVEYDWDNLDSTNFVVKTRAFNQTTVGPFSDPSGSIFFAPVQTTDALTNDTAFVDGGTGQLLTALALSQLLLKLGDLFGAGDGNKSIFQRVFDLFKDETGTDIVALTTQKVTEIPVFEDGLLVDGFIKTLKFTGDGVDLDTDAFSNITINIPGGTAGSGASSFGTVKVSGQGDVVADSVNDSLTFVAGTGIALTTNPGTDTVTITATGGGGGGGGTAGPTVDITSSKSTLIPGEIAPLTFTLSEASTNFTIDDWSVSGGFKSGTFSGSGSVYTGQITASDGNSVSVTVAPFSFTNSAGTGNLSGDTLTFTNDGAGPYLDGTHVFFPANRPTFLEPVGETNLVPHTGSYFILFKPNDSTFPSVFRGALTAGTGNVKLYKSDGTLVQTLTAAQLTFNGNLVGFPFNTRELGTDYYILMDQGVIQYCTAKSRAISSPLAWNFNTTPYAVTAFSPSPDSLSSAATFAVTGINPTGTGICPSGDLTVFFSSSFAPLTKNTGTVKVRRSSNDSEVKSWAVAEGTIGSTGITFTGMTLEANTQYYVTVDAGLVKGLDCFSTSQAANKASNLTFTTQAALAFTSFEVTSTSVGVNKQTNIALDWSKSITLQTSGTVKVYADGTLWQTFDLSQAFDSNFISELFWAVSGTRVIFNVTKDFPQGAVIWVLWDANIVKDACGSGNTALTDNTVVRFTVDAGPAAPAPTINSGAVLNETDIVLQSDRDIVPGPGNVVIYDNNNNVVKTIASDDPAVTFS